MKFFKDKNIRIIFIVVYLLLLVFVSYKIIALPKAMLHFAEISDSKVISKAREYSFFTLVISNIQLLFGLLLIVIYELFSRIKTRDNIVYISKYDSATQASGVKNESEDTKIELDNLLGVFNEELKAIEDVESSNTLDKMLSLFCKKINCSAGILYKVQKNEDRNVLKLTGSYAFYLPESSELEFEFGEGIAGQVAMSKSEIIIDNVPQGYIKVVSGLGEAVPNYLACFPIIDGVNLLGVLEVATFNKFNEIEILFARKSLEVFIDKLISK